MVPFKPREEAVIEVRRIIQPVFVQNQCVSECTQLEQSMPVGVVARKARYLKSKYDPDTAQANLTDQTLEALAVGRAGTGLPRSQSMTTIRSSGQPSADGTIAQRILALRTLGVLEDLGATSTVAHTSMPCATNAWQ
ncbi:hypothetical protein ABIF24_003745 [Bradyrhizobium elkanii]